MLVNTLVQGGMLSNEDQQELSKFWENVGKDE